MCTVFSAHWNKTPIEFSHENCKLLAIGNKIEVAVDGMTIPFDALAFSNVSRSKIEASIRKKLTKPTGVTKAKKDGKKIRYAVLSN